MHRADPAGITPAPAGPEAQHTLWLIAGTGEGPPLAEQWLALGWTVQVSVVSADATRAYAPHPRLIWRVGALAGPAAISGELLTPEGQARFRWVVDASHPFASRISAHLAEVCAILRQPLLRLERPALPDPAGARITLLEDLDALTALDLRAERLLLAIGARHLARGVACSGAAVCFARVLPTPGSLRLALGAGLGPEALACHRPGTGPDPGDSGAIERALLRRWSITAVLCRQSGGATEAIWRNLCGEMGLWLLLLRRPREPLEALACPLDALLTLVGEPSLGPLRRSVSSDAQPPAAAGTPSDGDPAG